MNIVKENKDALNAVLKLKIVKTDYSANVDKVLKDHRKKVKVAGFRPGMAPMGMVKKLYGKQVLLDQLNKLITFYLAKYLKQENLHILGDPIPNFDVEPIKDLDTQEEFEFIYDIGLAPEIDVNFDKNIPYPYYKIIAEDKIIEDQIQRYASRFSTMIQAEDVSEKSLIKGHIAQIDENGNILEFGITKDNAIISPNVISDAIEKTKFLNGKKGNSIDFNIKTAFKNETEISSMLGIPKDTVAEMTPFFRITINEINEYIPHEINEDLFKNVFGEEVKTKEEFASKVKDELEKFYEMESDYKFLLDVKKGLVAMLNPELPEKFLKHWLLTINKNLTKERVEIEYPMFANDTKWQLIKNKIVAANSLTVSEDEIFSFAKDSVLLQMQQYGITSLPEEHLKKYVDDMLAKKDEKQKITDRLYEEKVTVVLKNSFTLVEQEILPEEFSKLYTTENQIPTLHTEEHVHDEHCNHDH